MVRKVVIPIKLKFFALVSVIMATALALYVGFAIDLFEKDKSAYIFESALVYSENKAQQLESFFKSRLNVLENFYQLHQSEKSQRTLDLVKEVFHQNPTVIDVAVFKVVDDQLEYQASYFNQEFSAGKKQIDPTYFRRQGKSFSLKQIGKKSWGLFINDDDEFFTLAVYKEKKQELIFSRFIKKPLKDLLKKQGLYQTLLIEGDDKILLGRFPWSKNKIQALSAEGVRVVTQEGKETSLVAGQKILSSALTLVAIISKDKAFEAIGYLKEKSLYFSGLVLCLALILTLFFSNTLTAPMGALSQAARNFALKREHQEVLIKSKDEIGVLGDSFNNMSRDILQYMDEMKEKNRLEQELKVARLVQETFIPSGEVKCSHFSLASSYTPATECGGDWWGYFENGDDIVLILADATGHGAPAALLTATAHSSLSTLKLMSTYDKDFVRSPAQIMSYLNQSVCQVGDKVQMTCFVAYLSFSENKLTYANASHNPPFLYSWNAGEAQKEQVKSLTEANGYRLGHKSDANYEESSLELKKGDRLVLYTDGLTEEKNKEGKDWGMRRFLKSILQHIKKEPQEGVKDIMGDAHEFYQVDQYSDDVTLIIASVEG